MEAAQPVIDELRALEESLWRTGTRCDSAYMNEVLAPDFFEFGRSGQRFTREQCLVFDSSTRIDAVIPLQLFAVCMLDETNYLVTYLSEIHRPAIERANRASLWTKTSAGWKLRFHQGTPAA